MSASYVSLKIDNYILLSLGIFIYMVCDGIDGVHARNIRRTSKLGEYLDHIFDHFISAILVISIYHFIPEYDAMGFTLWNIPLIHLHIITISCCHLIEMIQYRNGNGVSEFYIVLTLSFLSAMFALRPVLLFFMNVQAFYMLCVFFTFVTITSVILRNCPHLSSFERLFFLHWFAMCCLCHQHLKVLIFENILFNMYIISNYATEVCAALLVSTCVLLSESLDDYVVHLTIVSCVWLLVKSVL